MMVKDAYRPCVGVMLLNRDGLAFIGRRRNKNLVEHVAPGHEWQMPQGGIDDGEEPLAAAHRELMEETGVTSVTLIAEAPDWLAYDLPDDIAQQSWRGKYRGQTQKWFAFRFTGADDEINIEHPPGGHKPEFDAWRWEPMVNLPSLIIPFKRPVYEQVVTIFAPLVR
ncbi:MAG TPA: RNA pyrophosphohydrolase [Beijerinckiaceae bacterium]|jgi:putative (di)nucleoside polyphosphate hydrolase|nr:RNA pyrophosphohydrolase [Beijerinckiaceae bacterium]